MQQIVLVLSVTSIEIKVLPFLSSLSSLLNISPSMHTLCSLGARSTIFFIFLSLISTPYITLSGCGSLASFLSNFSSSVSGFLGVNAFFSWGDGVGIAFGSTIGLSTFTNFISSDILLLTPCFSCINTFVSTPYFVLKSSAIYLSIFFNLRKFA